MRKHPLPLEHAVTYSSELNAWFSGGVLLGNRQEYDKAIEYFNKALQVDPLYTHALYNKAMVLIKLGQYNKALNILDDLLSIEPLYYDAWLNKGLLLENLAEQSTDPQEQLNYYKQSILSLEKTSEVFKQLEEKNPDQIKEEPSYHHIKSHLWEHKALLYQKIEEFKKAIACLDEGLKLNPQDFKTLTNQGILHLHTGAIDEALSCFKQAMKIEPTYIGSWLHSTLIYKKQNYPTDASIVTIFVHILAQAPEQILYDIQQMFKIQVPLLTKQQKEEWSESFTQMTRIFAFHPGHKKLMHHIMMWFGEIPVKK